MLDIEAILPESLEQCQEVLCRRGKDTALVAGGTDLFVLIRAGLRRPGCVVYLGRIRELRRTTEHDGQVTLGPTLTHSELGSLEALNGIDCLREAAGAIGSPQIRNVATVGGNLANASPAADMYPPLLALGASLEVRGPTGRRQVGLEDFVEAPGKTGLQPDEIITEIRFTRPSKTFYSGFMKIGLRNALAISVANAAVVAQDGDGRLGDVRIACGAVAPVPLRMKKVEALLAGEALTEELIREAAAVASAECDPVSDIRASREYRCHVTGVMVSRLLREAAERLFGFGHESK
jgi:CO/xanthine dehydrogenase FAD-binding subunit